MIKKNLLLVIVCSFLSIFSVAQAAQALDGIAATVNNEIIMQSDLNRAISLAKQQMAANNIAIPANDVLRKQALDQLINKKLQLEAAQQAGINVTPEQVDQAIKAIAQQNKISVKELFAHVAEQGMNAAEYKKEIAEEMQIQQIGQQEVGTKIIITPEEVKSFLHSKAWQSSVTKEYHLEDILITVPDSPTPEQIAAAKKRAQDLLSQIHKGANFTALAAAESGENNALQGGDLGWRKLPEIPSAFSDQLIHMQVNQVIGPIQTANGFHLIRLAGVRNMNQNADTNDEEKQVQQLLFQRKFEENLQNWVTRLRSAATIKIS